MTTVTISKVQHDILKRRASLYEAMLRVLPERKWGIEEYSSKRVEEFSREDRLGRATKTRLRKMLAGLP